MQKVLRLLFAASVVFWSGCASDSESVASGDYRLTQLARGVAFPPNATEEYRAFSIEHMNTLHFDWYRINQSWADREPDDDSFNWAPLTSRLSDFRAAGKKVLLTLDLKGLPDWWAALADDATRVSKFSEFCSALLAEYAGQIELIQFGNEWNWEIDAFLTTADNPDQLYIDMANALYAAVQARSEADRPQVVLGSVSIDALRFLSYAAGNIENVYFAQGAVYTDVELADYAANKTAYLKRLNHIVGTINCDYVDLHLYDEYWNWPQYLADYQDLIAAAGKIPERYLYIASEFGGPEPDLEPGDAGTARQRLIQYVQTLDGMGIEIALYFKLVEDGGDGVSHPNSYLINSSLTPNSRYQVMEEVGRANPDL